MSFFYLVISDAINTLYVDKFNLLTLYVLKNYQGISGYFAAAAH